MNRGVLCETALLQRNESRDVCVKDKTSYDILKFFLACRSFANVFLASMLLAVIFTVDNI